MGERTDGIREGWLFDTQPAFDNGIRRPFGIDAQVGNGHVRLMPRQIVPLKARRRRSVIEDRVRLTPYDGLQFRMVVVDLAKRRSMANGTPASFAGLFRLWRDTKLGSVISSSDGLPVSGKAALLAAVTLAIADRVPDVLDPWLRQFVATSHTPEVVTRAVHGAMESSLRRIVEAARSGDGSMLPGQRELQKVASLLTEVSDLRHLNGTTAQRITELWNKSAIGRCVLDNPLLHRGFKLELLAAMAIELSNIAQLDPSDVRAVTQGSLLVDEALSHLEVDGAAFDVDSLVEAMSEAASVGPDAFGPWQSVSKQSPAIVSGLVRDPTRPDHVVSSYVGWPMAEPRRAARELAFEGALRGSVHNVLADPRIGADIAHFARRLVEAQPAQRNVMVRRFVHATVGGGGVVQRRVHGRGAVERPRTRSVVMRIAGRPVPGRRAPRPKQQLALFGPPTNVRLTEQAAAQIDARRDVYVALVVINAVARAVEQQRAAARMPEVRLVPTRTADIDGPKGVDVMRPTLVRRERTGGYEPHSAIDAELVTHPSRRDGDFESALTVLRQAASERRQSLDSGSSAEQGGGLGLAAALV